MKTPPANDSSKNQSEYQYKPISSRDGFRLVKIEPWFGFQKVVCKIFDASTTDLNLEYQALSYTCGNAEDLSSVNCNGFKLPVTKDLYTLALDSGLQLLQANTLSDAEILAHVLCSSRVSRAWLLQRTQLSSRTYYSFADGPVDIIDKISKSVQDESNASKVLLWSRNGQAKTRYPFKSSMERHISKVLLKSYTDSLQNREVPQSRGIPSFFSGRKYLTSNGLGHSHDSTIRCREFATAWNTLVATQTSMTRDKPIILATRLGYSEINLSNLNQIEWHGRLAIILWRLKLIPQSLRYLRGLKHDGIHNNRWIPKEIDSQVIEPEPSMEFTNESLCLSGQNNPSVPVYTALKALAGDHSYPTILKLDMNAALLRNCCYIRHDRGIYRVMFNRAAWTTSDTLSSDLHSCKTIYLLIEPNLTGFVRGSDDEMRGALLYSYEAGNNEDDTSSTVQGPVRILATYDCAFGLQQFPNTGASNNNQVLDAVIVPDWQLTIAADTLLIPRSDGDEDVIEPSRRFPWLEQLRNLTLK